MDKVSQAPAEGIPPSRSRSLRARTDGHNRADLDNNGGSSLDEAEASVYDTVIEDPSDRTIVATLDNEQAHQKNGESDEDFATELDHAMPRTRDETALLPRTLEATDLEATKRPRNHHKAYRRNTEPSIGRHVDRVLNAGRSMLKKGNSFGRKPEGSPDLKHLLERFTTSEHKLCRHLVLAARRPLSLAQLFAADSSLSRSTVATALGDDLEVSGGMRPIVQFKQLTPLGGNAEDHTAMALCCLRTLQQLRGRDREMTLARNHNPFLRYAIEFVMKHADSADESMHAVFLDEFDYAEWQRWAVCLPVYAALNTYKFRGALLRLKCPRLLKAVCLRDQLQLSQEYPQLPEDQPDSAFSLSPWRAADDFESRRRKRQQQRDLLLGTSSSSQSTDVEVEPSESASRPAASTPTPARSPSPSRSSFSLESSQIPVPTSPSQLTLDSFEMVDLSDEELSWEEVEMQDAILESLGGMRM